MAAIDAFDGGDAKLALQLMETCAEQDDPVACFTVALWYRSGEGAVVDIKRSEQWLARLERLADRISSRKRSASDIASLMGVKPSRSVERGYFKTVGGGDAYRRSRGGSLTVPCLTLVPSRSTSDTSLMSLRTAAPRFSDYLTTAR
jgi:hypothetical protein